MRRPGWKHVVDFYGAIIAGDDYTESPPASYEPISLTTGLKPDYAHGQQYDVGGIVRGYQQTWLGVVPNHVTPNQLLGLLNFLSDMTEVIEERDAELRSVEQFDRVLSCEELGKVRPGYGQPCLDLQHWRARLTDYMLHAGEVPPQLGDDRRETLWTITAPLFVGWFGGATGNEVELAAGGFPPGFNVDLQHPADIATPYMLANQYGVADAWEKKRAAMLLDDFTPKIPDAPSGDDLKNALLIAGAVLGGVLGVGLLLRRK